MINITCAFIKRSLAKILCIGLLPIVLVSYPVLGDQLQIVSVDPGYVSYQGSELTIPLHHATSDGLGATSGLGLRIYYDSSALRQFRAESILQFGFLSQLDRIDSEDLDEDPKTDRYLLFAWVSIDGRPWPGSEFERILELRGELLSQSYVFIDASDTSVGYGFEGGRIELDIP